MKSIKWIRFLFLLELTITICSINCAKYIFAIPANSERSIGRIRLEPKLHDEIENQAKKRSYNTPRTCYLYTLLLANSYRSRVFLSQSVKLHVVVGALFVKAWIDIRLKL